MKRRYATGATELIQIRVTPDQKEMIKLEAARLGLSVTEYIIKCTTFQ